MRSGLGLPLPVAAGWGIGVSPPLGSAVAACMAGTEVGGLVCVVVVQVPGLAWADVQATASAYGCARLDGRIPAAPKRPMGWAVQSGAVHYSAPTTGALGTLGSFAWTAADSFAVMASMDA